MGATGIYFDGTAADARAHMLHIVQRDILTSNEKLFDYSFAKDTTDNTTEIYCAVADVRYPVFLGLVVLYQFDKKEKEIWYRSYEESAFPYHCNCSKKILDSLSPISEIAKAYNWSDTSRENAKKWRKGCLAQIAEQKRKKKLHAEIKKAVSIERTDKPFKIKTSVNTYNYWSLSDFKISGKFLKTGTCNFNCGNMRTAKFFLQEFQKAFLSGKAGYNTIAMTAF